MTTRQHQCLSRASRHLLYALKWLEKAEDEQMPDKELKRLRRVQEFIIKAKDKLF